MKVIQFTRYGGPEVLHAADRPTPEPAEGEVRIRIRAVAVNPADPKWRQGMFDGFAPVPMPHVVGYDVAGTVDALGSGVAGPARGERVLVMLDGFLKGGYAEYAVVPAGAAVLIPDTLDFAAAAAIPTAGLTGVQMAEEHADVKTGELILVTGAAGAVGRFAMRAARERGARVVAAVRPSQFGQARELGADEVVALDGREWTGAGFAHVLDTVGGPAVAALCRSLEPGGKIITAATTPIDPAGLASEPQFIAVHNDPARLAQLAAAVAAGDIPVPVARRLPLAQAAEAHRLVEAGGTDGKIILEP